MALVPGYIFDLFTEFEKAEQRIYIKDKTKNLVLNFFFPSYKGQLLLGQTAR